MKINAQTSRKKIKSMLNFCATANKSESLSWQQVIEKARDAVLKEKSFFKYWHYILVASIKARNDGVITGNVAFFHITQAADRLHEQIVKEDYWLDRLHRRMTVIEKREGLKDGQSFCMPEYHDNAPRDWNNALLSEAKRMDRLQNNYLDKILRAYGETAFAGIFSKKKNEYQRRLKAGGKEAYEAYPMLKSDPFVQCLQKAQKCLPKNNFIQFMTAELMIESVKLGA